MFGVVAVLWAPAAHMNHAHQRGVPDDTAAWRVARLLEALEPSVPARTWHTGLIVSATGSHDEAQIGHLEQQLTALLGQTPTLTSPLILPKRILRVLLDVGTHAISTFLHVPVRDRGHFLLAFEPQPLLAREHPAYDGALVLPVAVSATPGVVSFQLYVPETSGSHHEFSQGASILNHGDIVKNEVVGNLTVNVPCITLDSIISRIPEHIYIQYIKVDAQGADLMALKGASRSLKRVNVGVTFECQDLPNKTSSLMYYEGACIVSEARAWLRSHGFSHDHCIANPGNPLIREYNCHFSRSAVKLNQTIATHEGEMRFKDAVAGVYEPVYAH